MSFPEPFGLMVEPTESFSKAELDDFVLGWICSIEDAIEFCIIANKFLFTFMIKAQLNYK